MSGHTSRPLQVSYGASTDQLSNREVFPSFFRTVPSDRVQAVAMVELLQEFRWNWVAALGSDDEYGRQGLSLFSSLANTRGVCIAHEGLVPLSHATAAQGDATQTLLQQVNQSSVQVVVLFASARAARTLFSYSIRSGLSPKVWVASEAWLTSDLVMTLPGMAQMGTVLGFLQRGAPLPEFSSYVHTRLALAADPAHCASLEAEQPGLEEQVVGPRCPQCDHITPENVSADLPHHQAFAAYAAVYSVAQALHNTLLCNASGCRSRERVQPWQVRPLRAPGPRAGGAGRGGACTRPAPPTRSLRPAPGEHEKPDLPPARPGDALRRQRERGNGLRPEAVGVAGPEAPDPHGRGLRRQPAAAALPDALAHARRRGGCPAAVPGRTRLPYPGPGKTSGPTCGEWGPIPRPRAGARGRAELKS